MKEHNKTFLILIPFVTDIFVPCPWVSIQSYVYFTDKCLTTEGVPWDSTSKMSFLPLQSPRVHTSQFIVFVEFFERHSQNQPLVNQLPSTPTLPLTLLLLEYDLSRVPLLTSGPVGGDPFLT